MERTIFVPIKTPSEQREAPPCSPPLCYDLFIKAADSFCPGRPTELPSRGKVKGSKMCHFLTGPCGALNTWPRQRVLREPRGGHITFNLWKSRGSELSWRHTEQHVWAIHHRSAPPPPATPLFPLFIFLQLRQAFLSGDPTFDSSARLQVARRRGLPRVCELFRCQSLAVFSQKPQGKEKCCRRRTAAGWSPCSTHHFRRVLVVTSSSLSPQFELDKLEYWVDKSNNIAGW